MKLRFKWNEKDGGWDVLARRKSTQKFEVIGFCHASSRSAVAAGDFSLLVTP